MNRWFALLKSGQASFFLSIAATALLKIPKFYEYKYFSYFHIKYRVN
jgi:hypothetical protein